MDTMSLPRTIAPIVLVTLLRQLDAEDPKNIFILRCVSAVLFISIGVLLFVIRRKISSQPGGDKIIEIRESDLEPPNPMAKFMGDEDSTTPSSTISMTHTEFDMKKWNAEVKKLSIQSCIVAAIHLKWGYLVPIVISPTMALFGLVTMPLFEIHILNRTAASHPALTRPWTQPAQPSLGSAFSEAKSALLGPDQKPKKSSRRPSKKDE
uniref:Uncharacterized protein n=1 Tax=Spongospora subterranea TaxID=70186 RepID=A0A0H5QQJ8_9EUKA|eukprot:CRZ03746.1 hypothetical protein [Spongospora subterranea]